MGLFTRAVNERNEFVRHSCWRKCNSPLACISWAECERQINFFLIFTNAYRFHRANSHLHLPSRASINDIFMRQAPGISDKFLNFSRIINELVGTFRKPLLLLIFIIGFKVLCTCFWKWTTSKMNFVTREQAHPRNRLQKESCFLQISAFHACYFARAFAFSRVTSRQFPLNEIRNTESFSGAHPPLLSPASARRASNCAIWREIRENKWILTN